MASKSGNGGDPQGAILCYVLDEDEHSPVLYSMPMYLFLTTSLRIVKFLSSAVKDAEAKWREERQEDEIRAGWKTQPVIMGKDKSIMKIQKFQNKLKKFTASELQGLRNDIKQLDLSKYN